VCRRHNYCGPLVPKPPSTPFPIPPSPTLCARHLFHARALGDLQHVGKTQHTGQRLQGRNPPSQQFLSPQKTRAHQLSHTRALEDLECGGHIQLVEAVQEVLGMLRLIVLVVGPADTRGITGVCSGRLRGGGGVKWLFPPLKGVIRSQHCDSLPQPQLDQKTAL
jgi:hypothetical protein